MIICCFICVFYIFRKLFTLETLDALRFTKLGTQKLSATNARIWLAKHLLETSHTHLLGLELRVAMTCQPSPKDRTDLVEIEQLFQRLDEASEAHAKGLENRVVTLREVLLDLQIAVFAGDLSRSAVAVGQAASHHHSSAAPLDE